VGVERILSPALSRAITFPSSLLKNLMARTACWRIRPLAVGRNNWLHIAGDGGLKSAAVLLSVAASAKRHGVNPWA
jgi:hypothetical protein